jgi:hypothetical protein
VLLNPFMMKNLIVVAICVVSSFNLTYAQPGFKSVLSIDPINLSAPTKDKPQSKTWSYDGKWWCVLSATTGTKIFRLDGSSWTEVLTINAKSSKPDCWIVGDLVHILFYKGASNRSFVYTVKYDAVTKGYHLWDVRSEGSALEMPTGSETATLVVDKAGRMWVATNAETAIKVWWSDVPYNVWSEPATVARGIGANDICAITAIPSQSKIGIFWSNHNTKKFGFKTHADDSDPTAWSDDEIPASQSAVSGTGAGMADDHMNLKVGADGTLYCAAKSDYNRAGFPKVILLIRRPSGIWDNAYPVTMEPEGTQPVLLLNEAKRKIKIVYTSAENGGDIVYKETAIDNISFSPAINLVHAQGVGYDYASSTNQSYESSIVILATNVTSSPQQAVGVLASEGEVLIPNLIIVKEPLWCYPNPFSTAATINFMMPYAGDYNLTLYNANGQRQSMLIKGTAEAGKQNSLRLSSNSLPNGIYFVSLETSASRQTIKVVVRK